MKEKTNHYWNAELGSEFFISKIHVYFEDESYDFFSSDAVFSKDRADFGSLVLASEALLRLKDEKAKILDLGCGYGLIGILIALNRQGICVDMVDISERALELSKLNIQSLGLEDRINVMFSDKYVSIHDSYDMILTNPPIRTGKKNVHQILAESYTHLRSAGVFMCVIQKKQGALSAVKLLKSVYGNCDIVKKSKGYYVLCSKK